MSTVEIPDHDALVLTIQAVVSEALGRLPRDRVREYVRRHDISYSTMYNLKRWKPESEQSFNLRTLLAMHDCAQDMLNSYVTPRVLDRVP